MAAVVVATGEWDAADVGLAWPEDVGRVAPAFAGFLIALVAGAVAARRAGGIPTGADDLLPRTGEERGWFAAVAVTAGCCEELLYRGVLIAFGTGVLGLGVWPAAAIAVVVFGAAHLYQGAGRRAARHRAGRAVRGRLRRDREPAAPGRRPRPARPQSPGAPSRTPVKRAPISGRPSASSSPRMPSGMSQRYR